jgi:UDP-glucose 4-epimerase
MGFDPLVQFVHPDDVIEAFLLCLRGEHPGVFNLAPPDAMPLSAVIRAGGRTALPLPHVLAIPGAGLLWAAGIGDLHPSYLSMLRFSVVMDGTRARAALGFVPRRTCDTVAAFFGREGAP